MNELELLSLMVSTLSLLASMTIAYLVYHQSNIFRKSSIFTELSQEAGRVNEAYLISKTNTPYMDLLKITDDTFIAKSVIFFHQLNMLNIVYCNRHILKRENTSRIYLKWVKNTWRPWIVSESHLIQLWNEIRKRGDIYSKGFFDWLESAMGDISSLTPQHPSPLKQGIVREIPLQKPRATRNTVLTSYKTTHVAKTN